MLYEKNGALILERKGETLCIYAQGKNALRVRSTMNPEFAQTDWALAGATAGKAEIEISESCARIKNGKISATVTRLGQINFSESKSASFKSITAVMNTIRRIRRLCASARGNLSLYGAGTTL